MAGDPTHVSGTPVDVALVVVEDQLLGHRRVDQIAARAVDNALGLAGRTRGVQDEQRIFGVHFLDGAFGSCVLHQSVHVDIATVDPSGLTAGVLDHEAANLVRAVQKRGIRVRLQRGDAAATGRFVCSDDDLGAAVVDAVCQSVGREARKHDRVDRTDTGTGQHRIRRFGDHGEIQDDTITFGHTLAAQDVRHAANLVVQLVVSDVLCFVVRIVGLEDDRSLVAALFEVTVNTVVGNVQGAIVEPLDADFTEVVVDVFDLGVGLDPVQTFAVLAPECFGVVHRLGIHLLILCRINMSGFREFSRNWIDRFLDLGGLRLSGH